MSRFTTFLFGMIAGGALLQGISNFHVVHASDGFYLVHKYPNRLGETFVDIRSFTMADWAARPQLASALVQANLQHLLGDSTAATLRDKAQQLLPE